MQSKHLQTRYCGRCRLWVQVAHMKKGRGFTACLLLAGCTQPNTYTVDLDASVPDASVDTAADTAVPADQVVLFDQAAPADQAVDQAGAVDQAAPIDQALPADHATPVDQATYSAMPDSAVACGAFTVTCPSRRGECFVPSVCVMARGLQFLNGDQDVDFIGNNPDGTYKPGQFCTLADGGSRRDAAGLTVIWSPAPPVSTDGCREFNRVAVLAMCAGQPTGTIVQTANNTYAADGSYSSTFGMGQTACP
jgi:hypothetical protein